MKKSKIPTIIGIFLLTAGLAAGVLLVQNRQIFKLGASPQISPKNVRISNISDSAFTVSWVTDKQTDGFIKWGKSENSLNQIEVDEIKGPSFVHTISVHGLDPETTYFFTINSDGKEFDNNGIAWQVTTGSKLTLRPGSNTISGTVLTAVGTPAKSALVYVTVGGSSLLSTTTSENGSWVIPISSARTQNLASFVEIDDSSTLVEISVQAGPDGVASAQIYPVSAKPAPPIILGKTYNFKNLPPSETEGIPKAKVNLPEEATPSSGFNVPEEISTPSATTVTLESIDEGEVVTTTEPEFFGKGPPKTTLTITVESDPITDSVTVDSSGNWKWSPPTNLPEGTHKITITWRDASGILRTLTRTFVVQAAEGPAFESTPSASTPTPSPSATPTPTPSPSTTPSASPISSVSAIPDSGNLTPTVTLSIMGLGLIVTSFMVWKKADSSFFD